MYKGHTYARARVLRVYVQVVGNGKEEVERICTGKGHTYASAGVLQVYVQTLGMMRIRLTVTR